MADNPSPRIRNALISTANNLPDLIAMAQKSDPQLAESLTAKSLLGSKSVWAPPAAWLVAQGVGYLGLGWDASTSAMVSTLLAWGVVIVVRYFTRAPIGGIVTDGTAKTKEAVQP